MVKHKDEMNPRSLENLAPPWTPEQARKGQANSVIARKQNKEARDKLKMTTSQWAAYKKDVLDTADISSLDILKILMFKALEDGEMDTAADLAKSIAEFETPKLARVESVVEDVKADDLSDAELNARIKELMNGEDDSSSSPERSGEA